MNIDTIIETVSEFVKEYIIPNVGKILIAVVIIFAALLLLRLLILSLWEKILIAVAKLSDRHNGKNSK